MYFLYTVLQVFGSDLLFSLSQESLKVAFDAAKVYSHMFERFRLFYKENQSLDVDAMRQQDQGDTQEEHKHNFLALHPHTT